MSEMLNKAFETLEAKAMALLEEKERLQAEIKELREAREALQVELGTLQQDYQQESSRLTASNALLSDKLSKLVARLESMQQNQ